MLSQLTRFASVQDVPIDAAEMEVRATFPQLGKYGLDPSVGVAMERLEKALDLRSDGPRERGVALVETAARSCHAAQSLRVPVPVEGTQRLHCEELIPVSEESHARSSR